MAEWKITYNRDFVLGPMTPWVHRRMDSGEDAPAIYDPPRPLPIPGKGYAQFNITIDRFPFTFASLYELDEAIRVLELPELPTIAEPKKQLTVYRKLDPHGAKNRHWLNRLPSEMRGRARRRKVVWELRNARDAIKKSLGKPNVERSYGRDPQAAVTRTPDESRTEQ